MTWWRDGVLYQVYPRSFQDSNGDGVGDLPGVTARLDYLAWLGVSGIWLNPTMPSPNTDWGYDVSDYLGVHPDLGTPEDLELLVAEAGARGIAVLLDLVPNHTSDQHPWFVSARSRPDSAYRDHYVWAKGRPDGGPPNNWLSVFGGPAWTYDEPSGEWYLHNFLETQPDLNWWSDAVRAEFDEVLRHWFARGVAGFRIDVAHAIVKDQSLRDNLTVTEDDHPYVRRLGQRQVYNMNRPEVHDVLRRWRKLADDHDPARVLVGETYVLDLRHLAAYYGDGDELHLAFNFPFVHAALDAAELRGVVDRTEQLLPPTGWPVWTGSNHDAGRLATRWAGGDLDRHRCALLLLLCLRGTPVLYYGDEIGLAEVAVPYERLRDPVGVRHWPSNRGRDKSRTPMVWSAEPGAGFTAPGVEPWLPFGDTSRNVADQRDDPSSVLSLCRDLVALRADRLDLRVGGYEPLAAPPGAWAWRRGDRTVCAVNLSGEEAVVPGVSGTVAVGTRRSRDGAGVAGELALGPWEGAVVVR